MDVWVCGLYLYGTCHEGYLGTAGSALLGEGEAHLAR